MARNLRYRDTAGEEHHFIVTLTALEPQRNVILLKNIVVLYFACLSYMLI